MKTATHYNAIVIGLGAMGSATLYQLSEKQKPGSTLLGLEQFTIPNSFSSHHSKTRLTRLTAPECEDYYKIALRSAQLWTEIEEKVKAKFGKLWRKTGGLILGDSEQKDSFLEASIQSAQKNHLAHKILKAEEIAAAFPQLKTSSNTIAYYEEAMGLLSPEACLLSQLELAKENGAEIHFQEKLLHFEKEASGKIILQTDKGLYSTDNLILTTGAWMAELLDPSYADFFKIYRQVSFRFKIEESMNADYSITHFPPMLYISNTNTIFYAFPDEANAVKVGCENLVHTSSIQNINRNATPEEEQLHYQHFVEPYFKGITNECLYTEICLYTCTPDHLFLIDYLPNFEKNVIIASACSGRGFKHSAAIGEALANQILNLTNDLDLIALFGFKGTNRHAAL